MSSTRHIDPLALYYKGKLVAFDELPEYVRRFVNTQRASVEARYNASESHAAVEALEEHEVLASAPGAAGYGEIRANWNPPGRMILAAARHAAADFCYFRRVQDPLVPEGLIEAAIQNGDLTLDDIVAAFRQHLEHLIVGR